MSDVRFEASPRSRASIEAIANQMRGLFGLNEPYLPVPELLEEYLPIALGDRYTLTVREKSEMGNRHGFVDPTTGELALRLDVYEGVCSGSGRDRFTACHELGHFFMHRGNLNRARDDRPIITYRDPEWQAEAFASALLMPAKDVAECTSIAEVVTEFGVSLPAAKVRVRKLGLILPERNGW